MLKTTKKLLNIFSRIISVFFTKKESFIVKRNFKLLATFKKKLKYIALLVHKKWINLVYDSYYKLHIITTTIHIITTTFILTSYLHIIKIWCVYRLFNTQQLK